MGRGKRLTHGGAVLRDDGLSALRDVPLSDGRRTRVVPTLKGLVTPLVYTGDFSRMRSRVVGLHAKKTWDLAGEVAAGKLELTLEHDFDNPYDQNAVSAYATVYGERKLVGYLEAEDAYMLARELDAQATLRARPDGEPYAGADSKGGALDLVVYLAG